MMEVTETDEDWYVDCSDDEKYSYPGAAKGIWEPAPKDIKELYEKLAAGKELTLTWSWPRGRRSPSPEPCEDSIDEDSAPKEVHKEEKQVPTEFDFDDFGDVPPTTLTPRRTPGSKTPRSTQKRVARMDKIMDDLRKEKKSMSPGQRTMVPGHRPLPGLGGANRLTPKPGMFGTAAGSQRFPGSALTPGGPRPVVQRSHSPAAAQMAVSPAVALRPPLNSPVASTEGARQAVSAAGSERVSTVQSVVPTPTNVPSSGVPNTGNTSTGSISNPLQTVNSNVSTNVAAATISTEDTKPTQAVTMVQQTPDDRTPQRPALPKLKIRKDLIS